MELSCHVKLDGSQQAGPKMQPYKFTSASVAGLKAAKKADYSDALPCWP